VAAGLAEYDLPSSAPDQIVRLLDGLAREPDPHTTVIEPARALDIHVRDSLVALHVPGVVGAGSLVDIGAGAGFPGLPLAIALPEARVDLLDASSRKCAVIERLAVAAGVGNARAVHARVEDWARGEAAGSYSVATARAVAPLAVLVEYAAPLLALSGTLIAWKASVDASERAAGEAAAFQVGLEFLRRLDVKPYPGARSLSLYLYLKVDETPPRFPRRAGIPMKRPLGAG
jgi:16S rRNA (guanine527-N7)-methyltransferase